MKSKSWQATGKKDINYRFWNTAATVIISISASFETSCFLVVLPMSLKHCLLGNDLILTCMYSTKCNTETVPDNGVAVGESSAPSTVLQLVLVTQMPTQTANTHYILAQSLCGTNDIISH